MTLGGRNVFRPLQMLLAAMVAVVTLTILAHAAETAATANRAATTYKITPGESSGNITPAVNMPVMILADQTGTVCGCDDVGSTLMTVVHSTVDGELVWNGFESNGGGLTTGFSPTAGTHIVYVDWSHVVDLEVTNATSFHVYNAGSETANGTVTLIW